MADGNSTNGHTDTDSPNGQAGTTDAVDAAENDLERLRLQQSEQRFRAAVEAIEGVLWTNNASGEMVGEQPKWAELTGQTFDQYQGFGWADAVHPDDAGPTIAAWNEAVRLEVPFVFEHRVRRHDGIWRLHAIRAVPTRDLQGQIREWVGVHRDITDDRANQLRLQQIADNVEAVFYVHEIDGLEVPFVSDAYERIWGQSRSELYADPSSFLSRVHPDDLDRIKASIRNLSTGQGDGIEYRLLLPDGTEKIIHDRPTITNDPVTGNRVTIGFATDVTEQRRTQNLLARNAETFSTLIASNPFGIYVINADFKLIQVSRGAAKVFENIEPLIGRDFAEVLRLVWAEPFASEAVDQFCHTLATGEPYVSQSTIKQRANIDAIEAYDWRIERIVLPNGRFGVVCYFYDLSERNSYEEQLKLLVQEKEMLAREIDHRVKNSLAIVGSLLSMQRSATKSDETRAALTEAVNRVVAVSRVHERLHKSHQVGIIAFAEYLEKLCNDISSSLGGQGVTLDFAADAVELPAEQAMSLALIANELVTNAFKHGCAAGARRIAVTLSREADKLLMTVTDDGAGLSAGAATKSAGLGFKVIKTLSRQLGAALTVPKAGESAEFKVAVPYTPPGGV